MASDSKVRRRSGGSGIHTRRRSERLQVVVLVLLALGFLSMVYRVRELPAAVTTAREREAQETQQMQQVAKAAMRGAAFNTAATETADAPTEPVATVQDTRITPLPPLEPAAPTAPLEPAATPAASPLVVKTRDELNALSVCERERDLALIDVVRASGTTLCASRDTDSTATTTVTLFDVPGGIKSTVFDGLELNLAGVKIHRPIKDLSQDGGSHDPRFIFNSNLIHCRCSELGAHAKATHTVLGIWGSALARIDDKKDPASTLCDPALPPLTPADADTDNENVVVIHERVILIPRRDDHNPFFQISHALNAWIMTRALGWDLAQTRVVHLDAGYPSPVDALHQKLLSPNFELMSGAALMGKRVVFTREVMLPPWEVSGPMMQHLNDGEPCRASQLFQDFRHVALTTMGAPTTKAVTFVDTVNDDANADNDDERTESSLSAAASSVVTVTVITRRAYSGRKVQRVWRNEDEVLKRMREEYADLNVKFQSVDFVGLPLEKQMDVVVNSDVVIGMHGAGMVNVFWTRPETLVVEIFPKERRRWGYRNLCQFLGCDWHEFRGGEDIGEQNDPNSKDKRIAYSEWRAFFDSIFRAKYAQVQEQENDLDE